MNDLDHRRPRIEPWTRAILACGLIGVCAAIARAEWRSLPETLAVRAKLHVVSGVVHWLDPPGLSPRRALFLARHPGEPADLYTATVRTGPGDRVVSVYDLSNLTRSPNAGEESLVVNGRYAAFATRVADEIVAFTVVDTKGEHFEPGESPSSWDTRLRGAITRFQQTGRIRGYSLDRFEFLRPVRTVHFTFRATRINVRTDSGAAVRVDVSRSQMLSGERFVRERPRHSSTSDSWVTWAVDTVRAIPWIGPVPIAWAETVTFRTRHVLRASLAAGDDGQREVAVDLGDVLHHASAQGVFEGSVHGWPPENLHGTVAPVLLHEGEWAPMARDNDPFVQTNPGSPTPMYITFVRTDPERSDTRVYVLVWDPRQIELHAVPGSQEPLGATGETGSGAIPRDEATMKRLVAGFNGAFQGLHGEYGMYGEGSLLLPPKPYAATVALLADGSTAFGSWPLEQHEIPDQIAEFRQNLTAMVDQGQYNPWHRYDWGAVLNAPPDLRTARTGLCMTREGFVAFLWGADLKPRALGDAMLAARCVYGVHLDMNGPNTGFETYRVERTGNLPAVGHRLIDGYEAEGTLADIQGMTFRARKLVRTMPHHAPRYIYRHPRDFFYLLLRPVLPGPALVPVVHPMQPGEGSWHVGGLGDVPFPWPMARTRVRPDVSRPDHWVNLVRLDARRVALAGPDVSLSQGVVARIVGATVVTGSGPLRVSMTEGSAGARWTIGTEGTGLAGERLYPGAEALRGACIDGNGFLVMAVADRALPDLLAQALDLAGCGSERLALPGGVLVLPSGETATGEARSTRAQAVLSLVKREFVGARRIFPETTPVPRQVWEPVQTRRVRYFPNPGNNVTVQVRLAGQQPMVLALPGLGAQYVRQAYPDGSVPPSLPIQR